MKLHLSLLLFSDSELDNEEVAEENESDEDKTLCFFFVLLFECKWKCLWLFGQNDEQEVQDIESSDEDKLISSLLSEREK